MKSETVLQLSTILVLQLNWNQFISAYGITVLPPADVQVIDPGYLGQLLIRWTLPSNLENPINCSIRFQLQYFNAYEDRWTTIRTTHLSYSAQFDLEKDVHVRVHTLLRGPCVNGSEVQSPGAEVVLKPPDKGSIGSKIKSLSCVFYRREFLECTWESGEVELDHPIYHLFYWHREMAKTVECPKYIYSNGATRTGCSFPVDSLLEFTEFNICVNGSSAEGPLRPAYFTLQIQNLVKPAAIEILSLEAQPNGLFHLEWTPSEGKIPGICLEYEVESTQNAMQRNITTETAFTSLSMDPSRTNCFRVRSRVHQFCADSGFWSEWSRPSCLSDTMEIYMPIVTETIMLGVLAIFVIMLLILSLCLWSFRGRLKMCEKIKGLFYLPYKPKGDFSIPPMECPLKPNSITLASYP
ncbi:interleukin-13 receptor subunit alpha-2-like isoform X3 [Anguilla anguilla]|uniref:interleukin-13 receptor subunit alpha-2-like isoform X3 n=1 Tax=Anguilla anguilla TaxID=7936 RepID=UPI0015A931BA|nr:interleukin-13 receptor subunit alpha-2-like isoform X3 [Anguilla anguilla]